MREERRFPSAEVLVGVGLLGEGGHGLDGCAAMRAAECVAALGLGCAGTCRVRTTDVAAMGGSAGEYFLKPQRAAGRCCSEAAEILGVVD